MGNASSSVTIINNNEVPPANPPIQPPPNFMQLLINSLNALYQPPIIFTGNPNIDTQNLEKNLTNLSGVQFNQAYIYPFLGNGSSPPLCSDTSTIRGLTDFVNISVNQPAAISTYIAENVIPNGVPQIYARQAASDLFAAILNDSNTTPGNGWQCSAYHRVYVDNTGKTANYAIDAEFSWTVATAVDYSQTPPMQSPILFLRYIGLVYATKAISFDEPNTPKKPVTLLKDDEAKFQKIIADLGRSEIT